MDADTDEGRRAREDDLRFMAETGETLERAAARIGMSEASMHTWCRRTGNTALWAALLANSRPMVVA